MEQILASFDDQHVHSSLYQGFYLLFIGLGQLINGDVSQGGQLGAWPDGAGNIGVCFAINGLAGIGNRGPVDGCHLVLQTILGQHYAAGAKGVGFKHHGAGLNKAAVQGRDYCWCRQIQYFIAAFAAIPGLGGDGHFL